MADATLEGVDRMLQPQRHVTRDLESRGSDASSRLFAIGLQEPLEFAEKEIMLDQTQIRGSHAELKNPDGMTFKQILKICCLAGLVVLAFVGLGPASWQPRSGLGWEIDHFAGYFVVTLVCCLAWPRPLVVGGALVVFAVLLEGLQAFMPDRSSYYLAAVYSSAGVLAAALVAEVFMRARHWFRSKPEIRGL